MIIRFTQREFEIGELISQGFNNSTIAVILGSAERTVERHIAAIIEKMELRSDPLISNRVMIANVFLSCPKVPPSSIAIEAAFSRIVLRRSGNRQHK